MRCLPSARGWTSAPALRRIAWPTRSLAARRIRSRGPPPAPLGDTTRPLARSPQLMASASIVRDTNNFKDSNFTDHTRRRCA